jgi:hypothetical protein
MLVHQKILLNISPIKSFILGTEAFSMASLVTVWLCGN